MGKELKIKQDKIKELVEQANKMNNRVAVAFSKIHVPNSQKDLHDNAMDQRDLTDLALSFELQGETEEEKQADMDRQVREMVDAFQSGDPDRKKPYLDKIYGLLDETPSFLEHEISDANEFNRLIASVTLNQAYATKRNENADYVINRYNTNEKRLDKCAASIMNGILHSMFISFKNNNPEANNLKLKDTLSLEMQKMVGMEYTINLSLGLGEATQKGSNEVLFTVPTSCIEDVNKNYIDMKNTPFTFEQAFPEFDIQLTFARFVGENGDNKFLGNNSFDFIFIDDKPLSKLAEEELLQLPEFNGSKFAIGQYKISCHAEIMFRKALLKGDKLISFAIPTWDGEKVTTSVVQLKPNIAQLKQDLIDSNEVNKTTNLPEQQDVDEVYKNGQRYNETIINSVNNFLETKKYEYYDINNPIKSGLTFKNEAIIQQGIDQFDEIQTLADNAWKKLDLSDNEVKNFDHRDLSYMMLLFDIKGNNLEEKQADMDRQANEMLDAFNSGDPARKQKYLDLLYSSFEKSILGAKRDVQTPEELKLLLISTQLMQVANTKQRENPEYFLSRFKDAKTYEAYIGVKLLREELDTNVANVYYSHPHKHPLHTMATPQEVIGLMDLRRQITKSFIAVADKPGRDLKIKLSQEYDSMNKRDMYDRIDCLVDGMSQCLNDIDVIKKMTHSNDIGARDVETKMFYIGNESAYDLALQQLKKTKEFKKKEPSNVDVNKAAKVLIGDALKKGEKPVSFAHFSIANKGISVSVNKIRPDLTELHEREMSRHTWFRKKFFNWGIFTIHPREQKEIDKTYEEFDYHQIGSLAKEAVNDIVAKNSEKNLQANQVKEPSIKVEQKIEKSAEKDDLNISVDTQKLRDSIKNQEDLIKNQEPKSSSVNKNAQVKKMDPLEKKG